MKYLKLFEEINDGEPKVGDYVICYENSQESDSDINIFLSQNIGVLKNIGEETIYYVKYDYWSIPVEIVYKFFTESVAQFFRVEILFYSDDEEDCEAFMDANKYNI